MRKSNLVWLFLLVIYFTGCTPDAQTELSEVEQVDVNMEYTKFSKNRMMIVTVPEFKTALSEFINWKQELGFDVELHTIPSGTSTGQIQDTLQRKFDGSGLTHIILVGDLEHVPSPYFHGAPSDPSYALLEGNDIFGDALISRISVKNNHEMRNQVNKFIFYEKGQFQNHKWIQNAIVAGTHEFDGVAHTTGIVSKMKNYSDFFTRIEQILETDEDPYQALMSSISGFGANMMVINSHGDPGGFYSIRFRNEDIPTLGDFCGSFPFIHGAACSTGSFQWDSGDCFAETVLKVGTPESPAGPIGMLGFSCSTDTDAPMMAQRKAFEELYFNKEIKTMGELTYFSILYAMTQVDDYAAEIVYRHWHLFGDCSLTFWKHPPPEHSKTIATENH